MCAQKNPSPATTTQRAVDATLIKLSRDLLKFTFLARSTTQLHFRGDGALPIDTTGRRQGAEETKRRKVSENKTLAELKQLVDSLDPSDTLEQLAQDVVEREEEEQAITRIRTDSVDTVPCLDVVKRVIQEQKIILAAELVEKIEESCCKVLADIKNRQKKACLCIPYSTKKMTSNVWVSLLMLKKYKDSFQELALINVDDDDDSNDCSQPHDNMNKKIDALYEFVICDDAMYSGTQMTQILTLLPRNRIAHVVVGASTNLGVLAVKHHFSKCGKMLLGGHHPLRTYREIGLAEYELDLLSDWLQTRSSSVSPLDLSADVIGLKCPDSMSTHRIFRLASTPKYCSFNKFKEFIGIVHACS
jgi:hypothetical protein